MTDLLHLLREGVLAERLVGLAGPVRSAIADGLTRLGADVRPLEADLGDELATDRAAARLGPVSALVVDAAALFAAAAGPAPGERGPMRAAADGAWAAARAVAATAWIGAGKPGRLVLVAPRPGDGPHAAALRSALENLARTLSIEWSRHGIRTAAVTPGDATTDDEAATFVAYLVSPAGDYFSGCRLDLGAVPPAAGGA